MTQEPRASAPPPTDLDRLQAAWMILQGLLNVRLPAWVAELRAIRDRARGL